MDIFVGSLPFKIKEKALQELFEQYGTVSSVKIVINKATRQNKGFGFVVMPNEEEAWEAIKQLNGKEVMGRQIIVSKSEEDKEEVEEKEKKRVQFNWRKKVPKKKDKIITYGDNDKEPGFEREKPAREKKAKNFKVGARKKK